MTEFRYRKNARTWVPAVHALEQLGFEVSPHAAKRGTWWLARSNELELVADTPIELLGLLKLHETTGGELSMSDEDWSRIISSSKQSLVEQRIEAQQRADERRDEP